MQVDAAVSGLRYLPRDKPGVTSLIYFGFDDTVPTADDEICERWGGPSQEIIFHIHKRDEPRWDVMPGGDFMRRNSGDYGRVYFTLSTEEEYWSLTCILSVISHFPNSSRRCLNVIEGLPRSVPIKWRDDPSESEQEARETAWLIDHAYDRPGSRMALNVSFADRFLAKMAIGLGHTILGPAVSSSEYSDRLRSLLWNQVPAQHYDAEIRGTGFWRGDDQAEGRNPFAFEGAWTIGLGMFHPAFGYTVCTPSGRSMAMMISERPDLWRSGVAEQYQEMQFYVVVPERNLFLGPYRSIDYISHMLKRRRIQALEDLETSRVTLSDLPPRRLFGHGSTGPDE